MGEDVERQGVAVHQEAPATLFLKRLHVRLDSGEVESLREKEGRLVKGKQKKPSKLTQLLQMARDGGKLWGGNGDGATCRHVRLHSWKL